MAIFWSVHMLVVHHLKELIRDIIAVVLKSGRESTMASSIVGRNDLSPMEALSKSTTLFLLSV
ncbi:hypothetical protein OESDEN_15833 [Oesophagostomum dentatum]|uniref:Uncharacterized protein n=1 Tax=Oesophagostomum dentatum TaxID=61180 RepID=A0A0B1SGI9_OESDE|nr:hypothetical protein OESDEN_15833 [Oesophagostomum dentatum]